MHMENYQRTGDKCGEATMKLALANVYLEANRLQDHAWATVANAMLAQADCIPAHVLELREIDGAAILAPVTTDANDDGAEIVQN
ncbi:unnamed protein product, partial [Symbiodinium necroappetens]